MGIGEYMVQKRGFIVAGIVVSVLLLLSPLAVMADTITLPDSSPSIISTEVFENVLVTNDVLILFEYNIPYATPPTATADQLYLFSVLTADGSVDIGDSRPYPYQTEGYNYGISGIYFAPGSTPTWDGSYQIRIMGDPIIFEDAGLTAPIIYTTITADCYQDSTNIADTEVLVGNYLVNSLRSLQTSWATSLITPSSTGVILTAVGQTYLTGMMPGISYMAPQLMGLQDLGISPVQDTYSTNLMDTYSNRYQGTWVQDALDSIGTLFHTSYNLITGALIFIICIVIVAKSQKHFQKNDPALIIAVIIFYGLSLIHI